ncbi:hypothetical protein DL93DRAFT_939594 [Clavulina sp. PMI_390]|nr:hypothetical protein DL93DRAFT_939594 [Clavulina sp. PMI_390]
MRMLDPALLAGPASTIGIPMANPTTGLPMLGSILDVSRQSIASPPSLSPASSQVHLPVPDNSGIGSGMGGGRRRRPGLNNGSSTSVGRKMSFILEEAEDGDDVDSVSGSGSASGGSAPGSTIGVGTSESTPVRHSIALSAASARRSRTFSEGSLVPPGPGIARMASSSSPYRRSSAASVVSRASSTTSSSYHDRPPLNKYQRSSRTVDLPAYLAPSSRSGSPSPYSSHRRGSSLDLDHQSSLSSSYGSPLLLARATYAPSTNPNRVSSAIELSLPSASGAGRVATSMGSVEIVWGVGSSAGGGSNLLAVGGKKGLGGLLGGKNSSAISLPSSRRSSFIGNFSNSNSSSPTPAHIWHRTRAQTSPLGYSLRRPPPTRLKPAEVLVQVFAVGLDALDALVVRDKAGWLSSATFSGGSGEGAGWVPGRSFVGRAVEVGFEVRNCVRGDWVFGLLDLSKVRYFSSSYFRSSNSNDLLVYSLVPWPSSSSLIVDACVALLLLHLHFPLHPSRTHSSLLYPSSNLLSSPSSVSPHIVPYVHSPASSSSPLVASQIQIWARRRSS